MAENRNEWLIELFDADQTITGMDAGLLGKRQWFERLVSNKALVHAGNCSELICPECEIPHQISVDYETMQARCPESGFVRFSSDDVRKYKALDTWLFDKVRTALQISQGNAVKELMPKELWFLGDVRIDNKLIPAYLLRALDQNIDAAVKHFRTNPGAKAGLVFLTSPNINLEGSLPGGHRLVFLPACMEGDFKISQSMLERIWSGAHISNDDITHTPDFSSITIKGVSHYFSGAGQKKVIEYLFNAWQGGNPIVRRSDMMADIGLERTRQLPHLFKGHSTWRSVISYGEPRGTCRLITE